MTDTLCLSLMKNALAMNRGSTQTQTRVHWKMLSERTNRLSNKKIRLIIQTSEGLTLTDRNQMNLIPNEIRMIH